MKEIKIWFDITNTPQVHFLLGVQKLLDPDYSNFFYTAREFSETTRLLSSHIGEEFLVFGEHAGKNKYLKGIGLFKRFYEMYKSKIDFDLSISCGSENAIWLSKLKKKKSIAFGDNDLAKQWTYGRFVDYSFFPDAIDKKILIQQGIRSDKL